MLFIVGGLTRPHWDRLKKRTDEIIPLGDLLIGKPITGRSLSASLTNGYADELIEYLSDHLRQRPQDADQGVGLLFGTPIPAQAAAFASRFFPFLLTQHFLAPDKVEGTEKEQSQQFNKLRPHLAAAAVGLRRAVAAMQQEIVKQRNRTPLLLPLLNFRSEHLESTLQHLANSLPAADNPTRALSDACLRFRKSHPMISESGQQSFFQDARDVSFKSPGRHCHGNIVGQAMADHDSTCYVRGILRLGAQVAEGFHYDCTKGKAPFQGEFPNCHGAVAKQIGKPHLNIFPNDFIR